MNQQSVIIPLKNQQIQTPIWSDGNSRTRFKTFPARAALAWRKMIEKALEANVRGLLLTPTLDIGCELEPDGAASFALKDHAQQICNLALEYGVGLVDNFSVFTRHSSITHLLSWINHPNEAGHRLVAQELLGWFPITSLGSGS
jgi:acyl-CoA thioesterase I